MEDRINSFPPFIDKDSKILVLGSVPGVKSLEMQQYYAHPQHHFWKIMFHLLAEPVTSDYEEKVAMLQRNGIAVWDTIESCVRKGSKDTDIKNEEVGVNFYGLPSTSPLHTVGFEKKLPEWEQILQYL